MPKYRFECQSCQLRFERDLKMGEHPTHPCPECKDEAPRLWDGFGFGFAPGGTAPANSGVHGDDYPTADKAVGRSSAVRWEEVKAREDVKKQARVQGETPALIRHDGDGYVDYEPMTDAGRKARRQLADKALEVLDQRPAGAATKGG